MLQMQKLLYELKDNPDFVYWYYHSATAAGVPSSLIVILLLGILRYLGRNWVFDDASESTDAPINVQNHFF